LLNAAEILRRVLLGKSRWELVRQTGRELLRRRSLVELLDGDLLQLGAV